MTFSAAHGTAIFQSAAPPVSRQRTDPSARSSNGVDGFKTVLETFADIINLAARRAEQRGNTGFFVVQARPKACVLLASAHEQVMEQVRKQSPAGARLDAIPVLQAFGVRGKQSDTIWFSTERNNMAQIGSRT